MAGDALPARRRFRARRSQDLTGCCIPGRWAKPDYRHDSPFIIIGPQLPVPDKDHRELRKDAVKPARQLRAYRRCAVERALASHGARRSCARQGSVADAAWKGRHGWQNCEADCRRCIDATLRIPGGPGACT